MNFVSQGYDTTPNRKNQFILEKSAFLSFWYVILTEKRDGAMWASPPTKSTVGADAHIRPTNKIASIVRSIKTLTTKEIGESIFQRSYYDHVIRSQQDYNEMWEYIENNPRKWVIQKRGSE